MLFARGCLDHPKLFKFCLPVAQKLMKEYYKYYFRLPMSAFATAKYPIGTTIFYIEFHVKALLDSVAVVNIEILSH